MTTIHKASRQEIAQFLGDYFKSDSTSGIDTSDPILWWKDMNDYATCAKILSDLEICKCLAKRLSGLLEQEYQTALHEVNGVKYESEVAGAFSRALSTVGQGFGFSQHVVILASQLKTDAFRLVVERKYLYRDLVTRSHGEYAHPIQWLILCAAQECVQSLFHSNVSDLYQRSLSYISREPFVQSLGYPTEPVHIWKFLVDCFPANQQIQEDYSKNVVANTYRCPQFITVSGGLPADSWLQSFVANRAKKSSGPYMNRPTWINRTDTAMQSVHISFSSSTGKTYTPRRYAQINDDKSNPVPGVWKVANTFGNIKLKSGGKSSVA